MSNLLGGLSTRNSLNCSIFSLIFTTLGDFTATKSQIVDSRFPCVNNLRFVSFCSLADRILSSYYQESPGYPRCNIIYSFSLFYGPLLGLGLLLRMFCFLCFTSAVRNKLYYMYTGDEPNPLKNNTFETNMSNSAHNVSAKCTAGSVVSDSSPDGSSTCSTSELLVSY